MRVIINLFVIVSSILLSCSKQESDILETGFNYWVEIEEGQEYINFKYPNGRDNTYLTLDYQSYSNSRVYWKSPDSFATPLPTDPDAKMAVVNYSTYTKENGTGKQNVYICPEMIGDTLTIKALIIEWFVDPTEVLAFDQVKILVY